MNGDGMAEIFQRLFQSEIEALGLIAGTLLPLQTHYSTKATV